MLTAAEGDPNPGIQTFKWCHSGAQWGGVRDSRRLDKKARRVTTLFLLYLSTSIHRRQVKERSAGGKKKKLSWSADFLLVLLFPLCVLTPEMGGREKR